MTDASPAHAQVRPRLASGVELLGPMAGSGYRIPPHLVRRGDGQVLQVSPLLAAIAEAVDGHRDLRAIGEEVGRRSGRALHADDVAYLLEHKLRPLGLVRRADGSDPVVRRREPLLGLRARLVLTRPAQTRAITTPFLWLFRPPVVALVLATFVAVATWVTMRHGLGLAVDDALADPRTVLALVALILASGAFHEVGHAAACRYGGAEPGVMGAAVYLVWPAFYTDVTDSYRLDRRSRLRVDLGGLYFNAVFTVATAAAWAATGREALLVLVPVQLLQMVRQLVPVVRFDGYHILADLVGVPDLYARIRPTLRRAIPWRHDPTPNPLTRTAQTVVVAWVAIVVPVLVVSFGLLLWGLPALLGSALRSLDAQADLLGDDLRANRLAASALRVVAMVTVAFVPAGAVYLLARLAHRSGTRFWTLTERRPVVRGAALALAAIVAVTSLPGLLPAQQGATDLAAATAGPGGVATELAAGAAARFDAAPARVAPAPLAARTVVEPAPAPTPAPAPAPAPEPELVTAAVEPAPPPAPVVPSVVRPAWPFPFDRPGPPGAGDNQAFALTTTAGAADLAVATSLAWEGGGVLDNRNEAWALASCVDCAAVAVAFQVAAATGPTPTAVPRNTAVAYNEACERCRTVAVAVQLAVTLETEPTEAAKARVAEVVARIDGRRAAYAAASLDDIRAELRAAKAEVLALLDPWLAEPPTSADGEAAVEEAEVGAELDGIESDTSPEGPDHEASDEALATIDADASSDADATSAPATTDTGGSEATGTAEPVASVADSTGPTSGETSTAADGTEASPTGPDTTEPVTTEPVTTEPAIAEPATTESIATEPTASETTATETDSTDEAVAPIEGSTTGDTTGTGSEGTATPT